MSNPEQKDSKRKTHWFYPFVLISAIALSAAGFLNAVFRTQCANDAGRGGAFAVACSLAIIVVSRNYAGQMRHLFDVELPSYHRMFRRAGMNVDDLERELAQSRPQAMETAHWDDAANQTVQNWYLAISSFIGTIVWGFADIPALCVIVRLLHLHNKCP